MLIAIVSAMKEEISPIISEFNCSKIDTLNNQEPIFLKYKNIFRFMCRENRIIYFIQILRKINLFFK